MATKLDQDIKGRIVAFTEVCTALKKKQQEDGRNLFNLLSVALFEKYPTLESFNWKQYTDYFNDGDECRFRVSCDERMIINGLDYDEFGSLSVEEAKGVDFEALQCIAAEFVESFPRQTLKEVFGDHCEVTISRTEQPQIEEYLDHN